MRSQIVEYRGIGPETGTVIAAAEAFRYALDRCLNGIPEERSEFKEMLVEWYFSGNHVGVTEAELAEERYTEQW